MKCINQQGFQKRFKFIITERSNKCYRSETVKEVGGGGGLREKIANKYGNLYKKKKSHQLNNFGRIVKYIDILYENNIILKHK